MTPANIVGMAKLKGLDVIAVTDHNSALNLKQAIQAGDALGVVVIPGMEVTTKEDVHVMAYFYRLEDALAFGRVIDDHLPRVKNQPDLFGRQLVMGDNDNPSHEHSTLLLNATDDSLEQLCALIDAHHGVSVPAHINRGSNGMLGALGLMPPLPAHPTVEVSPKLDCPADALHGRRVLHSSDAHRLGDILERVFALDVEQLTISAVLDVIKAGRSEALES